MVSRHCQGVSAVIQAVPPQSRLQEMLLGPCPEALQGAGLGSARFGSSQPLHAQGVPLEPVGQCLQPFPAQEDKSLPQVSVGPARLKNECLCKIPGMAASSAPTPELLHPSKAKNVDRNLGSLLLHRGGRQRQAAENRFHLWLSLGKGSSSSAAVLGWLLEGLLVFGQALGRRAKGLKPVVGLSAYRGLGCRRGLGSQLEGAFGIEIWLP